MPRTKGSTHAKPARAEQETAADSGDQCASPQRVRRRRRQHGEPAADGSAAPDVRARAPAQPDTGARPQVPTSVVRKLVAFSLLLLVAPILAYFLSLNLVFAGSTAPAAITAAVAANVVLAAYVYAAWVEDQDDDGGSGSGGGAATAPKRMAS